MTAKLIIYWITTMLVSVMMAMAAFMYLTHAPKAVEGFSSLGYPAYFATILGVFKLLGAIALLAPGYALLKEWAYAGFTFTFIGACASHLAMGQGKEAVSPVIALVLLAISYLLRPATRRIAAAPPAL
jgi:uncharacterized membrane protein YphA (DoxX/SURF4 family)